METGVDKVVFPVPYIKDPGVSHPLYCSHNDAALVYPSLMGVCLRPINPGNYGANKDTEPPKMETFVKPDVLEDDTKPILTVAVTSNDGHLVVAGDTCGILYIWRRTRQNVLLKKWYLHKYLLKGSREGQAITDLCFSADSSILAVTAVNGGVLLSMTHENLVGTLMGSNSKLSSVTINGAHPCSIVTAGDEFGGSLWFHKYDTSLTFIRRSDTFGPVSCIRFSRNGEYLASCGDNGYLEGWSVAMGTKDRSIYVSNLRLLSLAWAPNNEHLVVACVDYKVRVVHFLTGVVTCRVIMGESFPVIPVGVTWSSAGWILALCHDGNIRGFRAIQNQKIQEEQRFLWCGLQAAAQSMHALSYSPDNIAVIADEFGTLLFLDFCATTGSHVMGAFQLPLPCGVRAIRLSSGTGVLLTEDGTVFVFVIPKRLLISKKNSALLLKNFQHPPSKIASFSKNQDLPVSHSGSFAVAAVRDYGVACSESCVNGVVDINVLTPSLLTCMWQLNTNVVSLELLDEERACAVFCSNGKVYVFALDDDSKSFSPLYDFDVNGTILATASTPDGALLAIALNPKETYNADRLKTARSSNTRSGCVIEFYDVENTASVDGFVFVCVYDHMKSNATQMALNTTGQLLACADTEHNITVMNIETGQPAIDKGWTTHSEVITSMAWDSNGDMLCSGSLDGSVGFWNTQEPQKNRHVQIRQSIGISNVAYINDKMVMVAGKNGCVYNLKI